MVTSRICRVGERRCPVELGDFHGLSRRGHGLFLAVGGTAALIEAERFELSIECRAADLQPPRNFGHLPAIVRNRVADDLGLDLFERAHVAVRVEQRQRVERGGRKRGGSGGWPSAKGATGEISS